MITPMILLASSLLGQTVQSLECANLLDRSTDLHTDDDLWVSLRVHSADDHIKDSHLCQTDYVLVITRAGGSPIERKVESIDDSWGRSVRFWIDGITPQSQRLIATIVERGEHPTFQIILDDLGSENVNILDVPWSFIEQFPVQCQAALKGIGMTRRGNVVIGFRTGGCVASRGARELKQGPNIKGVQKPAHPTLLKVNATFETIYQESVAR